jgi:RhtB (resistance to homoserine/threonine) family protein
MIYVDDFVALGIIALLGAMSPGPDFVVVTQNSLKHGRTAGIYTSLGITIGCLVHISYCILGIGVVVAESVILFNILKYLGAAYLIYLGIKGLRAKATPPLSANDANTYVAPVSNFSAFKKGLLVNLLNPKVTLFILSIFTTVISPDTPYAIQGAMGIEFGIIVFVWFSALSAVLAHEILKKRLIAVQHYVERIMGAFLILLGLKVATFSQS